MNKKIIAGLVGLGLIFGPGYGVEIEDTYASEAQDPVKEKEEELRKIIYKEYDNLDPFWIVSQGLKNRWMRQVEDAKNALEREEKSEASLDSLITNFKDLQKEVEAEANQVKNDYLEVLAKSRKLIEKHSDKLQKSGWNPLKNLKESRDSDIIYLGKYRYGGEIGHDWSIDISILNDFIKYAQEFVEDSSEIKVTDSDIVSVKQEIIDNFVNFEKLKDDRVRIENDYTVTIKTQAYKEANEELKKSYDEAYKNLRSIDENIEDFDVLYDAMKKLYGIRLKITEKDLPRFDVLSIENIRLTENNKVNSDSKNNKKGEGTQNNPPNSKDFYKSDFDRLKANLNELKKISQEKSFEELADNKKKEINSQIAKLSELISGIKDKENPTEEEKSAIREANNKADELISSFKKSSKINFEDLKKEKEKADSFKQSIFYAIRNGELKTNFDKAYGAVVSLSQDSKKEDRSQEEIDKLASDLKDAREAMTFTDKKIDDLETARRRLETLLALNSNIVEGDNSYVNKHKDKIDKEALDNYKQVYKEAKKFKDSGDLSDIENAYKRLYEAVKDLDVNKEKNQVDKLKALVDESEDFKKTDDFKNIPEDKDILRTSYIALIKEAKDILGEKNPDESKLNKIYDHLIATKKAINSELGFRRWLIKNEIYLEDKVKNHPRYKEIKELSEKGDDEAKKAFYKNILDDYDKLLKKAKDSGNLSDPQLDILYKSIKNYREILTNDKLSMDYFNLRNRYLLLTMIENHRAFDMLDNSMKDRVKDGIGFVRKSMEDKANSGQIKEGLKKADELLASNEIESISSLISKGYPEDSKVFDLNNLILKYGDLAKDIKYTKAQKKFREDFDKNLKIAKDLVAGKKTDEDQVAKAYEALKKSIEKLDGDKFEAASFALAKKFKDNQDKIKDVDKRKAIAEKINSLKEDDTKTMDDLLAIEAELDKLIEEGKSTLAKIVSTPSTADVKTSTVPVSNTKNSGTSVKTGIKSVAEVIGIGAVAAIILYFVSRKGDKNEINK